MWKGIVAYKQQHLIDFAFKKKKRKIITVIGEAFVK